MQDLNTIINEEISDLAYNVILLNKKRNYIKTITEVHEDYAVTKLTVDDLITVIQNQRTNLNKMFKYRTIHKTAFDKALTNFKVLI